MSYSGNGNVEAMILVTGATGQLGSHVLYELAKHKKPVRALYRNKERISDTRNVFRFYEPDDEAFNSIEWAQVDINDYHALHNAMQGAKLVFHTAGHVSFNDRERKTLYHVNAEGTANVVNACLDVGTDRLCHVSSIASIGELAPGVPVTESVLWNQGTSASAYAKSKYKGEMEVWRGIHEGLNAVIVNPSVIIGPGMWMGPGSRLFFAIEKGLKYYPAGSSGYVDVRDVAKILAMISEMPVSGERYILNAGLMSHREFMAVLATELGVRVPNTLISSFISEIAIFGESVRAFFTGSEPRINQRTLKIASEELNYSSDKIRNLLEVNFIPIEESVKTAVQIYRNRVKPQF
jgi:nucleoside-diphosphate-sugar epimerase